MKINSIGVEGNIISLDKKSIKKVGIIGCGSHVYRNIFPALRFVEGYEIISVCDLNYKKAELFGKKNGIEKYYSDYETMIKENIFDSIIIVVGYDSLTGKPLYPKIAEYVLSNGINVWMEKPPSDTYIELEKLKKIAISNNCFFQTGFKMMFSPSVQKVKEMFCRKNFVSPQSFYITYAVDMPTDIRDLVNPGNRRFLDDIVHIFSQLHYLFGKPTKIKYFKSGKKDGFIYLRYSNNLSGTIHIQGGISIIGPAEYLRVIGEGSFIELFSGTKIKYHNYGDPGSYGKDISYLRKDNTFTEEYSPELRQPLGALSLHSEALFGYISEFKYFFNNQDGNGIAGMQDSIDIIKVYDGLGAKEDEWFVLDKSKIRYEKKDIPFIKSIHICNKCNHYAYVKDGWTYSCGNCGKTTQLIDKNVTRFTDYYDKITAKILNKFKNIKSIDLINRANTLKGYERIYLNISSDKHELWGKFCINLDDFVKNEVNFSKIKSDPFIIPKLHYYDNNLLIYEKIPGVTLDKLIMENKIDLLEDGSLIKKIIIDIIEKLAVFHKNNKEINFIHNDFDPFNIIISEDFSRYYLIDMEYSKLNGEQFIDLFNFIFLFILIFYNTEEKREVLNKFNTDKDLINFCKDLILKYYYINDVFDIGNIDNQIKKFAKIKNDEIEKLGKNKKKYIYSYILEYDFNFLEIN